jgi:hypothetical protein
MKVFSYFFGLLVLLFVSSCDLFEQKETYTINDLFSTWEIDLAKSSTSLPNNYYSITYKQDHTFSINDQSSTVLESGTISSITSSDFILTTQYYYTDPNLVAHDHYVSWSINDSVLKFTIQPAKNDYSWYVIFVCNKIL